MLPPELSGGGGERKWWRRGRVNRDGLERRKVDFRVT
jgi:hypothetical protein